MISAIKLDRLRNAEHNQLLTDMLVVLQPQDLQCGEQISALANILAQMNKLFVSDPGSAFADEIAALDDIRDDLIIGLTKYCDAHTYNPDAGQRAAGGLLLRNIRIYGASIATQPYNAESATITSIVKDWTTNLDLIAAASLIGATEWISALEIANNNFKAKYLKRTDEIAVNTTSNTLKAKRTEANKAFYELRERIDSFYTIHNLTGPWGPAIDQMNALIDQYNAVLNIRSGRANGNGANPPVQAGTAGKSAVAQ